MDPIIPITVITQQTTTIQQRIMLAITIAQQMLAITIAQQMLAITLRLAHRAMALVFNNK